MRSNSVYLASQSPRRAQLLRQLKVRFESVAIRIDEQVRSGEAPRDYVQRLAAEKAQAAVAALGADATLPVLAADTAVVVEGVILGKPADREAGFAMLERLSGRRHQVLSAVALWQRGALRTALSVSTVTFRVLTPEAMQRYWQTGEPRDKAGGYAIQGRGAMFVLHLEGSYSGVMGLPLFETAELLGEAGLSIL